MRGCKLVHRLGDRGWRTLSVSGSRGNTPPKRVNAAGSWGDDGGDGAAHVDEGLARAASPESHGEDEERDDGESDEGELPVEEGEGGDDDGEALPDAA